MTDLSPTNETKLRLDIINYIAKEINDFVECIVLGGSMGYGQNFSVAPWCDVDTVVVIERDQVDNLLATPFFNQTVDQDTLSLFKENKISMFWSSRVVHGIEIDIFVYEKDSFVNFSTFKKPLTAYINHKPRDVQNAFTFSGEKVSFNRNVNDFNSGFIYEKPALANGVYWGGVPRDDFFFCNYLVYEKNSFYTDLSNVVWKEIIKQLIKEHGPVVDLNKYNVLNSMYTYQTNRKGLPLEIVDKIKKRTIQEIENVTLSQ